MKSRPRVISRLVRNKISKKRAEAGDAPPFDFPIEIKPKTRVDEIYAIIEDACSECWRFTDDNGRPWIEKSDIEDRGNGIYVVKFRCDVNAMFSTIAFNKVVDVVCGRLNSEICYFYKECKEIYTRDIFLRYGECVWIVHDCEEKEEDYIDDFYSLEEVTEDVKSELTYDLASSFISASNEFV